MTFGRVGPTYQSRAEFVCCEAIFLHSENAVVVAFDRGVG